MSPASNEGMKIPFSFIPFPKFLFDPLFFQNEKLIRFMLWAMSRTRFESAEFLFGRSTCAKEIDVSEQSLRTIINQLTNQQFISKVTSKSTSKITVYKWLWSNFPSFANQQINSRSTSKLTANQPARRNKIETEKEEKKQQQLNYTQNPTPLQHEFFPHIAAAIFEGKANQLLSSLVEEKRNAVIALYHKRAKSQPIKNAEAWIIKCIEEDWLAEEALDLPEPMPELSNFEINRKLASEIVQKFQALSDYHACLRNDFLEIGDTKTKQLQLFYCEPTKIFKAQIDFLLKKFGF